jgi:hypothetical protein
MGLSCFWEDWEDWEDWESVFGGFGGQLIYSIVFPGYCRRWGIKPPKLIKSTKDEYRYKSL